MNFDFLVEKNKDITELSNFKTPAKTQYLYEIKSFSQIDELSFIYKEAQKLKIPILFISSGTNTLFAFDEFQWLVIFNNLKWWQYDKKSAFLKTNSSEKIWDIASALEDNYGQNLWHRFIGLPGSIAGAVYGNAWCFWLETESHFVEAEILNLQSWEVEIFSKQDMNFSYRYSLLKEKNHYFILSASFDLSQKREKYASEVDNIYFREHMQPKWNSCGSFFKNPKWDRESFILQYHMKAEVVPKQISAGFLIESVWLKGMHLWGAYFSELHANFLMHDGKGSYRDLLNLISLAQKKIWERFGILLEPEVQIRDKYGKLWIDTITNI